MSHTNVLSRMVDYNYEKIISEDDSYIDLSLQSKSKSNCFSYISIKTNNEPMTELIFYQKRVKTFVTTFKHILINL